ncbi:MAG TPA: hypothetical protein VFE30_05950 [Anaeromyxobacteraceae bacterium]|jgi:hypothetical protein|nr:hypothetical protein [Anaeromyxobacteraceae bacterium]
MIALASKKTLFALAGLLAAAGFACSSSTPGPSVNDAASLDQAAAALSTSVAQYRQAAAGAATSADCQAILQQYLARTQPMVAQLQSTSGKMDDYLRGAGMPTSADVSCGGQVMVDEMAHHQAVACASADMAANHAEDERHAAAMQAFATHAQMRAVQAGGMMGGAGTGGPAMMGAADAGWMMGYTDGGWAQADGGVIGFAEPMPGCAWTGGTWQPPDGGYWMDGGWTLDGGPVPMPMVDGGTVIDGGPGVMMDGGMMP